MEKREVIPGKSYRRSQSVLDGEIGGQEKHPEPNYIACRMGLHQVHYLKNFSLMPPPIGLPADGEINHYKRGFAVGSGVVKVVLDQRKQDIQS